MKKTIKPIAIMLITAIIAVIMAGCNPEPTATEPAAKPTAEPAGGEVADNTPITLASETTGTKIYYTQDGTEPGAASTLYSDTDKPLITTGKLTLKAIALKDGMDNSAVLTATYTIAQPPVIQSIGVNPPSITVPPSAAPTATSVTFYCNASGADGSDVASVAWSIKSRPAVATPSLQSGSAVVSDMTVAGTYKFEAEITGSNGAKIIEEVTVIAKLDADVSFVALGTLPNQVIDFSPSNLPMGATYTLTDDRPIPNTWNSTDLEFDGKITAGSYYVEVNNLVTFTQTFYLNGVKITGGGSQRTVVTDVATVANTRFMSVDSDTGAVKLEWPG